MQRNRSSLRASLSLFVALGVAPGVALTGCDKAKSDDGGEAKSDDGGEKKADDGGEAKPGDDDGDAAETTGGGGTDEVAALKAEKEAMEEALKAAQEQNEKLAAELDKPIEEEDDLGGEKALEEGKKGPVSLANVSLTTDEPAYGVAKGRKTLKLRTDVTLNEKKDGGVYAKTACQVGDDVYVDVMTVTNKYGELGKMNEGDTKNVDATAFNRAGLAQAPERCQVSFDFGASSFSVRLADYCWDGSSVKQGACAEALAPAPKGSGTVVPFGYAVNVEDARFTLDKVEGQKALHAYYDVRVNETLDHALHLALKTACKVGEKTWVAVSPDFPHVKPFKLSNGEVFALGHSQFYSDPLPGDPEWCQMDVLMSDGFGKEETSVASACWKPGGEVADGTCRDIPEIGEIEPVTAETLSVDKVGWMWKKDYKKPDKAVLMLNFVITGNKPVAQWTRLKAQASCDKSEDKEHRFGPDLSQIMPGESFGVNMSAFWREPIDAGTDKCEIKISAEKMGEEPAEVATLCIRGDKASPGACKKAKKGKKAGVDQFYTADFAG